MSGSDTDTIRNQVQKCPSGALSFYYNNEQTAEKDEQTEIHVEVKKNGPLIIQGDVLLKDQHGVETKKGKVTAFCRCGLPGNKPYCDGSHKNIQIDG